MPGPPPQDVAASKALAAAGGALHARLASDDLVEWSDWAGIPIVTTFGEPQAEYAAIRKGAAIMDWPQWGAIEVTGADRHAFLNNLLTNSLLDPATKQPIARGHGCYAFVLNLKGRIVADVRVIELEEGRTLLICDRHAAPMLVEAFDRYLFAEKVKIRNASEESHLLALHGPDAPTLLAEAADAPLMFEPTPPAFPATHDLPCAGLTVGGAQVAAWREDTCGVPGFGLIVARDQAVRLWDDLLTRFGTAQTHQPARRRLRPAGWSMFNACRIEAGTPMLGVDFAVAPPSRPGQKAEQVPETRGGTLPAEAGPLFARAVSVTGGCYLGQEVVARMHARNVVARRICGIRMDEDALPSAGAEVDVAGDPAGIITSSTLSPVLSSACIALAMLKRPHFEPGTSITVPAEGCRARGTVIELPFVR